MEFYYLVGQDGIRGLYNGMSPNIVGASAAWGFYFFFYNQVIIIYFLRWICLTGLSTLIDSTYDALLILFLFSDLAQFN